MPTSSYSTTRFILAFAEAITWIGAVIFLVQAITAMSSRYDDAFAAPLFGMVFASIVSACVLRIGRAILDIADCQRTIVAQTVPRDAIPASLMQTTSAALPDGRIRDWTPGETISYGEHTITGHTTHVEVEGRKFDSMRQARDHLDGR